MDLHLNLPILFFFLLSAFVYFYGGWLFLTGLAHEFKKLPFGMMTLIAVAITVAFGYSAATK